MVDINIDASGLLKWSRYFNNIPKRTRPALARALNTAGELMAHNAAKYMADQSGLDPSDVYDMLGIKEATADDLEWTMDASSIAPPSLDWSRPWATPDTSSGAFEQTTLVKVVTMGDDQVCELCERAKAESPYTLEEVYQLRRDPGAADGCLIHPNCILPGTVIEGDVEVAFRSLYFGDAVEIVTNSGKSLRLTVNHPVMTPNGWVAAGSLRNGMNLLTKLADGRSFVAGIHQNKEPIAVENVFDTFYKGGIGSITLSPTADNLHGDAAFIKGNIDVVFSDRSLLRYFQTQQLETVGDLAFPESNVRETQMPGFSSRNLLVGRDHPTTEGFMSLSDLARSSRLGHMTPFKTLRLGLAANWDVVADQQTSYNSSVYAEFFSKFVLRSSGAIELDEIIDLRRFKYEGHVYDLQTTTGWMIANRIGISNCRCGLAPWTSLRKLPVTFGKPGAAPPELFTVNQLTKAVADELMVELVSLKVVD